MNGRGREAAKLAGEPSVRATRLIRRVPNHVGDLLGSEGFHWSTGPPPLRSVPLSAGPSSWELHFRGFFFDRSVPALVLFISRPRPVRAPQPPPGSPASLFRSSVVAAMVVTPEYQQLFLNIVAHYIGGMPVTAGLCDAAAALALACAARGSHRLQLSCWGWRAMHRREVAALRALEARENATRDWMQRVATLIRSNCDIAGGSLMHRIQRAISESAVLEGMLANSRSAVTPQVIRDWVQNAYMNNLRWWAPHRLADDQTSELDGEFQWSESEDEI